MKNLTFGHYDLVSPDGIIETIQNSDSKNIFCTVSIQNISPRFIGFDIDKKLVLFNLKSTLAQLGLDATCQNYELDKNKKMARVNVHLFAVNHIGEKLLSLLTKGVYIGKLFAADNRRKVRDPNYLMRMFGRCDEHGRPLLSLGHPKGRDDLILEKKEGRTIAFLNLKQGIVKYAPSIDGFLQTVALALKHPDYLKRELLHLHQVWNKTALRVVKKEEMLLVKTRPLHIRTVFAKVADTLLPSGFHHTSACVLQPDTFDSGDIYEFRGQSMEEIHEIPLEFYTLEPYREYVFFSDRDQLQASLEDPNVLFKAFQTAPEPKELLASAFVVKGTQLLNLKNEDWITKKTEKHEFPGLDCPERQALLVEKYIEQQPAYPFLRAIEESLITSQGILLSRHFPSPLLKRLLLSSVVQRNLKGLYFNYPSLSNQNYFSHEDRAFLLDLAKFAIPVFWVDEDSKKLLQYVVKPGKDTGMFVPLDLIDTFRKATFFGIYGSNLQEGHFEGELKKLLQALLDLRFQMNHPLFGPDTPLALLTGGGPGAMEVGNRVAKSLNILSCGNVVDFRHGKQIVNEQRQNPYLDAKMTYRLDRLVERQAEFNLDFPILLPGGIGLDFEYTLEEVRRKTGSGPINPILLFGDLDYWEKKVTSRFKCNRTQGTTAGSEWVSNCFYSIQNADQGLEIYKRFFLGKLAIGKNGPLYDRGFCHVATDLKSRNLP